MRRATQFAPVFNFNDSPNDVGPAIDVFRRTRAAVEICLAPMNLSAAASSDEIVADGTSAGKQREVGEPAAHENGRQHLAWLLAYTKMPSSFGALAPFLDSMTPEWVADRSKEFELLSEDWQRLEQ
ncbi:MAG: hypothetical protein EOP84_30590 [Verrucomicrobiaceae bacterium]|nr:MAG: hypothetical protein EOP84_30590 [Verrucomicrobiaceae bacterium]